MTNTKDFLEKKLNEKYFSNFALSIGYGDNEKFSLLLDSDEIKTQRNTLFDIASITKIVAVTLPALFAIENKKLSLDDTLSKFFDVPQDKKDITIYQLLTHTGGFLDSSMPIIKNAITPNNVYNAILNYPLAYKPSSKVMYSCPGFILLGKILEIVYSKSLDCILKEYVIKPFGLKNTCFKPQDKSNAVCSNVNITECGLVNDYNARFLGGISGNAGVFSSLDDILIIKDKLINKLKGYISENLFEKTISNLTPNAHIGRGLGFYYVDKRCTDTGAAELFSDGAFGHTGWTGTSMFMDIKSGLYVVYLSNIQRFVSQADKLEFRRELHSIIKTDIWIV